MPDDKTPVLRLEPEKRLCPEYDPATIKRCRVADPGETGFRVLDNFCEDAALFALKISPKKRASGLDIFFFVV